MSSSFSLSLVSRRYQTSCLIAILWCSCLVLTSSFAGSRIWRTTRPQLTPSLSLKPALPLQQQHSTWFSTRLSSTVMDEKEVVSVSNDTNSQELTVLQQKEIHRKIDWELFNIAWPAFFALAADPLASFVDAMYVGRLTAIDQAAMGIAISAHYSVSKLYNDPLLKTSTSLVAGKEGDELQASVASAVTTAIVIGIVQSLLFVFLGGFILKIMGVSKASSMRPAALSYLQYRALGIPAATVQLVINGIFRGRGDTKTPLYCTLLGNVVNIVLDPILIFTLHMGCAGAGAATAISQWITAIPLLYLLNKSIPLKIIGRELSFYQAAMVSYVKAGGLLLLRTVAKIMAYSITSSAAARLGTIPMAAYSVTFNLGFATTQLCESISIAAQALLAREYPFKTTLQREKAGYVIRQALILGTAISGVLSLSTWCNQDQVLRQLTKSVDVFEAAKSIMPIVLLTQILKGLVYSTGGIILGGLDWFYSSLSMQIAAIAAVIIVTALPINLTNIWISLAAFMGVQVIVASARLFSGTGPWGSLKIFSYRKLFQRLTTKVTKPTQSAVASDQNQVNAHQ